MKLFISILFFTLTLHAAPNPSLQHAGIYSNQNVTGWMMSEKLDGIRGYWDGKAFYTKKGKRLNPPKGFTSDFPPFALDGEFWSRRGDYENIQSQVLRRNGSWDGISYNIFEVPNAQGNFTKRLGSAREWFRRHPNLHVSIIEQTVCKGPQHLNEFLETVAAKGGEGVMVKDPALYYVTGRTTAILKVKKAHDMEGTVVALTPDKTSGKFKSLTLELDNGIRFRLGNGFSDRERKNPPPVGSVVTFKYYGFTKKGKPKFASFLRIRKE